VRERGCDVGADGRLRSRADVERRGRASTPSVVARGLEERRPMRPLAPAIATRTALISGWRRAWGAVRASTGAALRPTGRGRCRVTGELDHLSSWKKTEARAVLALPPFALLK
jgi:hypothetical protein